MPFEWSDKKAVGTLLNLADLYIMRFFDSLPFFGMLDFKFLGDVRNRVWFNLFKMLLCRSIFILSDLEVDEFKSLLRIVDEPNVLFCLMNAAIVVSEYNGRSSKQFTLIC